MAQKRLRPAGSFSPSVSTGTAPAATGTVGGITAAERESAGLLRALYGDNVQVDWSNTEVVDGLIARARLFRAYAEKNPQDADRPKVKGDFINNTDATLFKKYPEISPQDATLPPTQAAKPAPDGPMPEVPEELRSDVESVDKAATEAQGEVAEFYKKQQAVRDLLAGDTSMFSDSALTSARAYAALREGNVTAAAVRAGNMAFDSLLRQAEAARQTPSSSEPAQAEPSPAPQADEPSAKQGTPRPEKRGRFDKKKRKAPAEDAIESMNTPQGSWTNWIPGKTLIGQPALGAAKSAYGAAKPLYQKIPQDARQKVYEATGLGLGAAGLYSLFGSGSDKEDVTEDELAEAQAMFDGLDAPPNQMQSPQQLPQPTFDRTRAVLDYNQYLRDVLNQNR